MSDERKKYKPIKDWRLFVGERVTRERLNKLMSFDFEGIDDLSLDDIFAAHSEMYKRALYAMLMAAEELWGIEKADQLAFQLGYKGGTMGWTKVQKHFRTGKLEPDQIAWYQDMGHLFYGASTKAFSDFDDEKCIVTREKCLYKPPEELGEKGKNWCRNIDDGFMKAYCDCQPGLVMKRTCLFGRPEDLGLKCDLEAMNYTGGTLCQHIWKYKK